jgi:putative spermidine/putrescine transport system permease protein
LDGGDPGNGTMKLTERTLLLFPLAAVLCALLLWPLAVIGFESLQGTAGAWTPAHYLEILADPLYRNALWHSLFLSAAVASIATLVCLGPAWLFAQYVFPGKRLMRAMFALPMSLSGIMIGFFAILMLGRIGVVPQLAQALIGQPILSGAAYQMTGLVIAYLYFEIPRGVLTLETSLRQFDSGLDVAARSLGAKAHQRFFWIVLPLVWRSVLSTFGVTFSISLGSFGVALILSRRFSILPLELFHEFTAFLNTGLVSAMAMVLIGIGLGINALTNWQPGKATDA